MTMLRVIRRLSSSVRVSVLLFVTLAGAGGAQHARADEPTHEQADQFTREQVEFFESKVRPILVEHCYACHSTGAEDLEAGLVLDSKWGWETGGDSGPAIVPGDLDESLFIHAIRYSEDVVSGMPPRSKLAEEQIEILEHWVEIGAPDPRPKVIAGEHAEASEFDLRQRVEEHWSWKPIADPSPPSVQDSEWPQGDLDRFVLAKIEQAGLKPAPPANRRRWLRRIHFDLTGLPPSPEEIDEFLSDQSPDAHRRVVDRLLDSRHFGEKWARHWLDLVRYAETYGHEFDYPIPGATEYRDYVIRALNTDVPYDQFVREHIAGDLLSPPRRHSADGFNESVLGTGFWYLHEATHAPTDVLGNEAGIIDNQLDVFGKSFLGLTIACARCHDHKFDAISTEDYYGLSAYIQSSCRQVIAIDVDRQREESAAQIRKRRELAAIRLSNAWRAEPNRSEQLLEKLQSPPVLSTVDSPPLADGTTLFADFEAGQIPPGWSTSGEAFVAVGFDLALRADGTMPMPGTVDSAVDGKEQIGILRSPTFEITTKNIHLRLKSTADVTVHVVIDNYQMAPFSALLFKGTLLREKAVDTDGRWQWKSLGKDLKKYLGHRAYLEVIDSGNGSIAIDTIVFSDGPAPKDVDSEELSDESLRAHVVESIGDLAEGRANPWLADQVNRGRLSLADLDQEASELIESARKLAESLPPPRFAVAIAEGTPEDAHVYIRGSHTNLGEAVPARFIEALGGRRGSRLDLANEVASPENPLTARVAVNRIWHHLFGRGIVPTVDDFGPQGQPPSHPQLLDWLAQQLIRSDWSLKHVIRTIVLSQTYRQDSVACRELDPELIAEVDPTNILLHRMPVRRLSAELIRDAIFSASGRIDLTSYGPSVPTHRTEFMTGRGARPSGPLDGNGRRSIYLSVYRNFLNPFMLAFDTPSPFGPQGRRSQSNVPAQALTLMNDPMVIEQAKYWAVQISGEGQSDPAETIRQMVETAHGIDASPMHVARLEEFLHRQAEIYGQLDHRAWADLAHALFNMKAFYFLQ